MPLKTVNPAARTTRTGLGTSSSRGADGTEGYHNPKFLQSLRYEFRFRRQVEQLCRLGPYALACLIEDIASGADLRLTVAVYAELDVEFIATLGGDKFPLHLLAIGGGAP
jgi:hypothetical protein